MFAKNAFIILLKLIFPPKCIFCGRLVTSVYGEHVCENCRPRLAFCDESVCCIKCWKPIVSFGKERLCYYCANTGLHGVKRIVSVFQYKTIVKRFVLWLKKDERTSAFNLVSACMAARFYEEYEGIEFDLICSAPSHSFHRWRGFDHGERIAQELSKRIKVHYKRGIFLFQRKNKKQSALGYTERAKNMHKSLCVNPRLDVKGKTVLVTDDVCTTRATMMECGRALKAAGAKSVFGLVFATTAKEDK